MKRSAFRTCAPKPTSATAWPTCTSESPSPACRNCRACSAASPRCRTSSARGGGNESVTAFNGTPRFTGVPRASVAAGSAPDQLPPLRRPPDLRAIALVLLLCGIWGVQQVVMKGVAADVAPTLQLAIRFAGASIFFGLLVALREGPRAFADGTLRSGLALGLMFSLEFVFVGAALVHTTAAHTIVFLYSAPIFTALGLQFIPEERLDGIQWIGIAAAFFGIVVAFVGPGSRPIPELIVGDLLALLGGAAWGLTNVVLRRGRVGGANTAKTVLYQV